MEIYIVRVLNWNLALPIMEDYMGIIMKIVGEKQEPEESWGAIEKSLSEAYEKPSIVAGTVILLRNEVAKKPISQEKLSKTLRMLYSENQLVKLYEKYGFS